MEDNGFRDKMSSKSNEELLDILQHKRNDYQAKAILDVENVLKERCIEYQIAKSEEKIEPIVVATADNYIYGPFLVGIVLGLVSLINPSIESHDAVSINLTINILFRAIVLFWSYNLCERFSLNKSLWMILGLLVGGWSLIAINVAIWFKVLKNEGLGNSDNIN